MQLYSAAARNGIPLPAALETRYQDRIRALQRSATRRTWLLVAAIVVAGLLGGGAIAVVVVRQVVAGQTAAAAKSLQRLIEDKRLDEAQAYVQRLEKESPAIAGAPQVAELAVRLQGLVKSEEERKSQFKNLLALVRPERDQQPNTDALKRAKELARTDEEKLSITKIEADLEQERLREERMRHQAFEAELRTFTERLEQLAKSPLVDLAKHIAELQKYRGELQALRDRSHGVSQALLKQAEPLRVMVDSLIEQRHKEEAQQAVEVTIAEKMKDLGAFRAALAEYAGRFPGISRSRDFLRAVKEDALWNGLKVWNDLGADCLATPFARIDAKRGGELLRRINQAVWDNGGFPCVRQFQELVPYLEAIAHRTGEDGEPLVESLKRLFENRFVKEVWMIEQEDQRYYLKAPITLEGDAVRGFRYLVGFDFTEKNATVRRDRLTYAGDAPQVSVARKVQGVLATLGDENWEDGFLDMLAAIADKPKEPGKPDMDPLLKLQLLRETARVGREGSRCLARALPIEGTVLDIARDDPLASTNWLDPHDFSAQKRRAAVRGDLLGLPNLTNARRAVDAELDKLRKLAFPQYQGIGWLRHDADGVWRCVVRPAVRITEDGKLYVLRKGPDGGAMMDGIGVFRAGVAEIGGSSPEAMVEGRPVIYSSQ